jgi:drug/metabolite transporter (DMT)-like permease
VRVRRDLGQRNAGERGQLVHQLILEGQITGLCRGRLSLAVVPAADASVIQVKAGITDRLSTRMPSPSRPAALALLGATSIAPMPVLVALAHDGPVPTAVYRCGLALPVLWAFAFAESRRRGPRAASNRARAFVAGLFLAVDLVLFNHTITDAGAGISTVIGSLYVPIVAVLGWALLRERPSRRYLATLPVVVGGIVLASGVIGGSGTGLHPGAGIAYGAAANVAYAGYLLTLRNAASDISHVAGQLFDATAGATIGAVLFGLVFGGLQLAVSWQALGWLVLLALVVQVAGWLLITASLPGLPAALSSLLLLLQPALALVLAGAVLDRWPTPIQMTGAAITCAGVVTAARSKPNTHVPAQITDPRDAESSPSPRVNYVRAVGGSSKKFLARVSNRRDAFVEKVSGSRPGCP